MLTQLLQPTLCGSASTVTIILNVNPNSESIGETVQTLSLGMRLKTVELGTQFKNSLKDGNIYTEVVEKTYKLLEKERAEKNALARNVEKLERDMEGYIWACKEKDSKIALLTNRLKKKDKDAGDDMDKLRKEFLALRQAHDETLKKLKQLSSKAESSKNPKAAPNSQIAQIEKFIKQNLASSPNPRRAPSAPPGHEFLGTKIPCPRGFRSPITYITQSRLPKPSGKQNGVKE